MKTTMRLAVATLLLASAAGARADTGREVLASWSGSIPAASHVAGDASTAPPPLASWNGRIPAGSDDAAAPPRGADVAAAPASGGPERLASWT
ncbi:MAG: hypothetical protein ACJ79R_14395, partial [Anaeromyxobacteraceae bacterium]